MDINSILAVLFLLVAVMTLIWLCWSYRNQLRVMMAEQICWMLILLVCFVAGFVSGSPLLTVGSFLATVSAMFAAAGDRKIFFLSLGAVFVGMVLPFLVFSLSSFGGPTWKGECQYGWVDCFQNGKMALLPLVFWAVCAFQVAQVIRPEGKPESWVVSGLFLGTVISAVCLAYYRLILPEKNNAWWLIIPLVTLIWYGVLTCRAMVDHGVNPLSHLPALIISSPLGFASVVWSKDTYAALPNHPPAQCFVVTAASKGHEELVGPFALVVRRGEPRQVNQQLLTFWKLEALWQERAPVTHGRFRRVYNRVGPWLAQRIDHRLKADLVYLVLKPFEWVARGVVRQCAAVPGVKCESRAKGPALYQRGVTPHDKEPGIQQAPSVRFRARMSEAGLQPLVLNMEGHLGRCPRLV